MCPGRDEDGPRWILRSGIMTMSSSAASPPPPWRWIAVALVLLASCFMAQGCQFYPLGENRRFERVEENISVDREVFRVQVFPRREFKLEAVDNSHNDIDYFKYEEVDEQTVAIKVARSLEDLVDKKDPQNVLKFKLTCKGPAGTEESFLPVTVYVQDINDHAPQFENTPYFLEVDELTPVGLTVFRNLLATDRDKPGTANSDVTYSIVGGNLNNSFAVSDPIQGIITVNRPLDYDHGPREYKLQIQAADHGSPTLSSVTTLTVRVKDSDDQNPVFSRPVYRTSVLESASITGARIRSKLATDPPIHAYDQDTGINAPLRYHIAQGNQAGYFEMHAQTGELFLVKEVDLEALPSPMLILQIQATQVDNPLRVAIAKVEVEVLDVNDNVPVFEYDTYNITVMENLPQGFTVVQVYAQDRDKGDNAAFRYRLEDPSGAFSIDEVAGWVSVKDPARLDRETKDTIFLKVRAVERKPNVNPAMANKEGVFTTVEVHLLDANDNNPRFIPDNAYSFSVTEIDLPGTVVGTVKAVDPDLGLNGQVIYFLQNDSLTQNVPFVVDARNGSVMIHASFSEIRLKPPRYTFFVTASDQAAIVSERRTSSAVVNINVLDVNNNPPEFVGAPYEAYVGESLPPGAMVFHLSAKDPDADTVLKYSIVAGNDENHFAVDPDSGRLVTATVLDFETKQHFDLLVQASDGVNTAVSPLTVHVVDINDQQPVFTHNFYNLSTVEELTGGETAVGALLAVDGDSGRNAAVRYRLLGERANEAFRVAADGGLFARRALDREREPRLEFLVVAFDGGTPQLSGTATVAVTVLDINDNAPRFDSDTFVVHVPEEEDPPRNVYTMKATDADEGENAEIRYHIVGGNEEKAFDIDPESGVVFTTDRLDFERRSEYTLHVAARNTRPFQGPSAAQLANPFVKLLVKVQDINDEVVRFEEPGYQFRVPESAGRGTIVGRVNATNPHRSATDQDILYWLEDSGSAERPLWINPNTGEMALAGPVDRDPPANQHSFKLKVFARDQLSKNQFNASVPVTLLIDDVNDNAPTFNQEKYVLELPESLPLGTGLPRFFRASDIDSGDNGKIVRYWLNSTDNVFGVHNTTGTVSLLRSLDYESRRSHSFTVYVMDGGTPQRTGSATVEVSVQNVNEFGPEFAGLPYDFWVEEGAARGTLVGRVAATDGDGDGVTYTLSGGDAGFFSVDRTSGQLYVARDLDAPRTSYSFIVRATDDGQPSNHTIGVKATVRVKERNDFPPTFTQLSYHGALKEKDGSGRPLVKVQAVDRDLQNNSVTYLIRGGNDEKIFDVDASTGEIRALPSEAYKLDYDRKRQYSLLVEAKDAHIMPLSGLAMVIIDILDINDHPPTFSQASYSTMLEENLPPGHCFLQIDANSGDSVDSITYSLETKNLPFSVHPKSGEICTKQSLDRETKESYDFIAIASDGKFDARVPVMVKVLDENDNPPKFERERYIVSIPPQAQAGRTLIQVHATDPDIASNGAVTYWIKNGHGLFEIDSQSGEVRLAASLPVNTPQNWTYEMEVFARDHGSTSNLGRTSLVVRVSNALNRPPRFTRLAYGALVAENSADVPLVQVQATDPDLGPAGTLKYRIVRASARREAFRVDPDNGLLTLVSPLDYEVDRYLEITLEARDISKEPQFTTTVVQIVVLDVNDHAPQFLAMPRILRVPASHREAIYKVRAIDRDSGPGGEVNFDLVPPSPVFSIDHRSGQIYSTRPLSAPLLETLNIIAFDGGTPAPLTSSSQMMVEVYQEGDVQQDIPMMATFQYLTAAQGTLEPGASIVEVRAQLPSGGPLWYNLTGGSADTLRNFAIHHDTGRVTAAVRLEPSASQPYHHFLVSAHNRLDPRKFAESAVIVHHTPLAPRCPRFSFSEYFGEVRETAPPDTVVIPSLLVEEAHKFEKLNYQITEDNSNDNFYVDVRSSNVSLRVKKPLDRDSMPSSLQGIYTLTVTATNSKCAANIRLKILIEDVNDNSPVFEKSDFVVELKENAPPGHVIGHFTAKDRDGLDRDKLRYFVVDGNGGDNFKMEEHSGVLAVNTSPDREKIPAFLLRIFAVDTANNTGTANVHVTILDENDWTPTFLNETFLFNVTEGPKSVGAKLRLPIVDYDEGANRQVDVAILEGNADRLFSLSLITTSPDSPDQGAVLTVTKELDREAYGVPDSALHLLVVAASDRGIPSRTGTATVAVVVHDINDSPPAFERDIYYEFVNEDLPVGAIVTTLSAKDADAHARLHYSFAKNTGNVPFAIDPNLGAVNISRQLDVSESREYTITVEVSDGLWKDKTTLKVVVSEAEARDPRFEQGHYRFAVLENLAGALVGQVELRPRKHRLHGHAHYSIVNADARSLFNVTKDGHIFTRLGLDREKRPSYTFTVMLEERKPSTKVSVSEVTVEVIDVNDETPTFPHAYTGKIRENSPPGTQVSIDPVIQAIDKDSGNNSKITYSLSGAGSEMFTILDNGLVIFSSSDPQKQLDRETVERYDLRVTAKDMGNLSSTTYLSIELEDENDNRPIFQHGEVRVLLPETARPGHKIAELLALDPDAEGPNSKVEYRVVGNNGGTRDIRVDPFTGEVYVVSALRPGDVHLLNVSAVDGLGLASFLPVNVTVLDVNDHRPEFVRPEYTFTVPEGQYESPHRAKIGVLHAIDKDTGNNGRVEYAITTAHAADFPFVIDVYTGELFVQATLDREETPLYNFVVMALDSGDPPLNSTVNVTVEVEDVNDERPRFFTDPYLAQVQENLDPGQKVTQITAYDGDSGINGQVYYKLADNHENKFYIDSKDGTVWTLSKLDYEKTPFYNLTVVAYDGGTPRLSGSAKLWVTVVDTEDAVPEFPKAVYTLEVAESRQPGEVVYTLDAGQGPFTYSLLNPEEVDAFDVEPTTGDIRLIQALDSVQRSYYRLQVRASVDTEPPKSDTAEVNIIVGTGQGVRLFPSRLYEVTVFENQLAPRIVLDLNATEELVHRPVTYSLVGRDYAGLFSIEPSTGRLSVMASLDREARDKYTLKVRADKPRTRRDVTNGSGKLDASSYHLAFDEALVVVNVGDENDNPPVFTTSRTLVAAVPLEATFGYRVAKVTATDADIGYNAVIKYEIVRRPDDASFKFHVDPVSGVIRSMVTFALDGGGNVPAEYKFEVRATDREGAESGHSATLPVSVSVLPETRLVLLVASSTPLIVEQHAHVILSLLSNVTDYEIKLAKLEPHHEGEYEDPQSTDLFLYALDQANEIVDTEILLSALRRQSEAIHGQLARFGVRRIQGVSVHEKISQMGTTEVAIIALSSVIFLGAVLAIGLLCSSCKKKQEASGRGSQKAWSEHQRLYSIKNPLMNKTVGNPYGSRSSPNGTSVNLKPFPEGGTPCNEYVESGDDRDSSRRRFRQPDGASSLTASRSPKMDHRYKPDPWHQDLSGKDGADSMVSGFSHGSRYTSWSSRPSRAGNPVTEL